MAACDSEKVTKTFIEYIDEVGDVTTRTRASHRGRAHQEDAVLHREPVRELAEAVGQPRVVRHVRHDARAAMKPAAAATKSSAAADDIVTTT